MVWPQTGAAAATVSMAPLINWLLVFKLGFGLEGAAAATVLLYAIETAMLLVIVFVRDRRLRGTDQQTWHGWCAVSEDYVTANQRDALTPCLPSMSSPKCMVALQKPTYNPANALGSIDPAYCAPLMGLDILFGACWLFVKASWTCAHPAEELRLRVPQVFASVERLARVPGPGVPVCRHDLYRVAHVRGGASPLSPYALRSTPRNS